VIIAGEVDLESAPPGVLLVIAAAEAYDVSIAGGPMPTATQDESRTGHPPGGRQDDRTLRRAGIGQQVFPQGVQAAATAAVLEARSKMSARSAGSARCAGPV